MENDLRHNEEEDDWLRRRQVGVEDGNRIGLGEDERRGSSIQLSPAEGEQAGMPIAEQQEKAAVNKGVGDMVEGSEVRVDPVPEFRSSMAPTATRLAWLLRSRPVDVPHAIPSNPTRNELGRRKTVGADKSDRRQRTARSARLPASGFPVSMGLVGNWRGSLSFASQYGADQELKMSPNVAGGVLEVGGAGGDGERKQGATGDPETSADGRLTSTAKTAGPAAVMASGVGGKNGSTNAPQSDTGTPGVAATGLQGGGPTGGRGVVGPHVEYAHETSQPIFVILLTLMAGTVGGLLLAVCVLFACKYCNRRHYGNGLNWQERYE
ncbi:unnamed protein product [Protopolystoma xenopodis]|uniref:Uncharacterized protein n=1 Tax=Protopolystoma xenopodis TaxID=117903 RepID=A0A3S5CSM1_9PLAT|nr:unnamed protein product [Protopolystoma xenopodis]